MLPPPSPPLLLLLHLQRRGGPLQRPRGHGAPLGCHGVGLVADAGVRVAAQGGDGGGDLRPGGREQAGSCGQAVADSRQAVEGRQCAVGETCGPGGRQWQAVAGSVQWGRPVGRGAGSGRQWQAVRSGRDLWAGGQAVAEAVAGSAQWGGSAGQGGGGHGGCIRQAAAAGSSRRVRVVVSPT